MDSSIRRLAPIPFRLKLLAFGGTLALVPIVVLGGVSMARTRDGMKTLTRELQVAVASDIARAIDGELRGAQDGLDRVGRTLMDATLGEEHAIRDALHHVSADELIDHVGVYGPDGRLVDVLKEETLARHALPERLPELAMREVERRGVYVGDVRRAADGARVFLLVPVRVGGDIAAYAASDVTFARVQERVERVVELRLQSFDGTLYVVDAARRPVAHADVERVASATPLGRRATLENLLLPGSVIEESSGEERVDGVDAVVTAVRVPSRPFVVVSEMPAERAYAAYFEVRRLVTLVGLGAALAAVVAALVLARRITRPIETLARFATDLAHRRFDQRVTVATRDELAVLGSAMSEAARELEASEHKLREEQDIRRDLGRYLPEELVEKVVAREHDMGLGGRRRQISVIFADVVAFTPLTEKLAAEQVVALLNELFSLLTEIVFRHGGSIDKFIGDAVMAVFGATVDDPEHAKHAVAAAEEMLSFLETAASGFRAKYGVELQLAIGVNSGEAVVGNIGSTTRMEFTAIGDVVNVAARLESIARPQQILVSGTTRALAGDGFQFVDRGSRDLPGREAPLDIYEVVP